MIIEELNDTIKELKGIANSESLASIIAKKFLKSEVTTHNIIEIKKFINSYQRNRS